MIYMTIYPTSCREVQNSEEQNIEVIEEPTVQPGKECILPFRFFSFTFLKKIITLVRVIHFRDTQDLELKEDAGPQQTSQPPPPDPESLKTSGPEPEPQPQAEPHPETQHHNLQEAPVTQQPQKADRENQSTQADTAPSKVCSLIKPASH